MELWELYEQHEKQVRAILKEDGCMDSLNRVRVFHGKRTDDKLLAQGHDSLGFNTCKCGLKAKQ